MLAALSAKGDGVCVCVCVCVCVWRQTVRETEGGRGSLACERAIVHVRACVCVCCVFLTWQFVSV